MADKKAAPAEKWLYTVKNDIIKKQTCNWNKGGGMICSSCNAEIPNGEEHVHNNKKLCEDCYIDILSAAKFCDPWATYNAQSFAANNPEAALTKNQQKIMQVLEETGGTTPNVLIERLSGQVSPEDGERECAALHRMDKIKIENRDGSVFIRVK